MRPEPYSSMQSPIILQPSPMRERAPSWMARAAIGSGDRSVLGFGALHHVDDLHAAVLRGHWRVIPVFLGCVFP